MERSRCRPMLTSEQFDRTRRLALTLAGIELAERHRELLGRGCRRLGILDGTSFDSLLGAAEGGDTQARRQVVGLITTNFTGFFRHPSHFNIAAEHAILAAERRGHGRLWCAAAATGEEPYSLAITVLEAFRRQDAPVIILASDIDEVALATAERGEYGERSLRTLDAGRRDRFFDEAPGGRRRSIAPVVRRLVEFRALNLADVVWPVAGPFDVIFCRNVLMYLETCHRYAVIEHMVSLLQPDGILILDPAEHLGKAGHWFSQETEGVYVRRRPAPTRHERTRASEGKV